MQLLRATLFWLWRWASWTVLLTTFGSAFGVLLYLTFGPLFVDLSIQYAIIKGIRNGGFYFFVWAPGSAIVICVMEAWSEHKRAYSTA